MTYSEWRDHPPYAEELSKVLETPVLKLALSVIAELTAAKTLGNTNSLMSMANNAHVLFGFDAGRASVISDLENLCRVPEEIKNIEPSYLGNEF
jgi:hypothetical protein